MAHTTGSRQDCLPALRFRLLPSVCVTLQVAISLSSCECFVVESDILSSRNVFSFRVRSGCFHPGLRSATVSVAAAWPSIVQDRAVISYGKDIVGTGPPD